MKFDPYVFAKEHGLENSSRATCAIRAISAPSNSTNSTNSAPRAPKPEISPCADPTVEPFGLAPPSIAAAAVSNHTPELGAFPYGSSCGGRPRTWTGNVISLDEWRRASEWDRHGSTGQLWNGLAWRWEPAEGGST